jgi:hypothetical protein
MLSLAVLGLSAEASAGQNVFSVSGNRVLFNGQPFKVIGVRLSNGLVSDAKVQELITNLDVFKSYGVNTISVFFMGSRFGDIAGYAPDASLDPTYAARMAQVIEAADARGMIVLVGTLYWGTSTANAALGGWGQTQANLAVANTVRWLNMHAYRNVFVDPDNEGMSPFTDSPMIAAGHAVDPSIMIACNRGTASVAGSPTDCGTSADLNIHYGPQVAGKPWLQSEGVPNAANYWGAYSKIAAYNNYIRIGLYDSAMKTLNISDATNAINNNAGYILASTWLQAGPGQGINGPFMSPGGYSNVADVNAAPMAVNADAGVKWWLEAMKTAYGAWSPAGSDGGVPDASSPDDSGGQGGGDASSGGSGGGSGANAGGGSGATSGSGTSSGASGGGGGSGSGGTSGVSSGSTGGASAGAGGTAGSGNASTPIGAASPSTGAGCSCDLAARGDKPRLGLASVLAFAFGLRRRRDRRRGVKSGSRARSIRSNG